MLKQYLLYPVLIITAGLVCQCSSPPEPRKVNRKTAPDFVRDIPTIKEGNLKGQNEPFYEEINSTAFALQLDSLETGYDSLQLRIWLGHSLAKVKQVVVLKYRNKQWKGHLVSYGNDPGVDKKVRDVQPASGWPALTGSLYTLKITALPNQTDIPGYERVGGADGIAYCFEIASQKGYRTYSYNDPANNTGFWQAEHILKIAGLLENEFDFQYLR